MSDAYNVNVRYQFSKAVTPGQVPATVAPQVLSPGMPKPGPSYWSGGWPIPVMAGGMAFRDVATTGLRQFGGWIREEFLPQLLGRQAARTYREMIDNSATIGSLMFAIRASMRRVEWRVEAADDSALAQQRADFVEEMMEDMSHTWTDLVDEMCSKLAYGFAPCEIVYKRRLGKRPGPDPLRPGQELAKSKYDDGLIGWRRLPIRGQDTILKWFFDENGSVKGLTQQPWFGPLIDLPIEKVLLFRMRPHKNNPEGYSILRTAYRSWYLAKRLEEQEAILFERLSGLPVVKVPNELLELAQGGNALAIAQLNAYKALVTNVRIDEQMGLVLPSNTYPNKDGSASAVPMYHFELLSPTASRSNVDSDKSITRYNVNMLTAVMADFLQLGHQARGTQALATNKVDMFFQAIEGFLNSDADVINRYGVDRIWRLNALEDDMQPKIKPDLAQRLDLDVLSNYVLRLSQAGMPIFPDLDVENYLRDAAGIPDVTEEAAYAQTDLLTDQIVGHQIEPGTDPNDPGAEPGGAQPGQTPAEQEAAQKRLRLHQIVKASIVRRLAHQGNVRSISTEPTAKRGRVLKRSTPRRIKRAA